jgi:glycosyltransferase involved in cell wall biosynthesis
VTEVSVVIPTRDRPELLALTLRSVLWQERVDAEVLVVDDGAGPGTAALVGSFADARVQLLRNNGPAGVSGARNSGVAAARGEWIAFLDDDDLWAPAKLVTQLTVAAQAGAGWVYAGDVTVDEDLRVRAGAPPAVPQQVAAALRRYNAVPAGASNVVVRRDVLDRVGRFDQELRTSEDWDLWLRLASTGLPACVPRPLVALRAHHAMASRAVDRMLADLDVIGRRHHIPVDRARHERWAAWMCLEDGRRWAALRHYARAVLAGDPASLGRAAVALVNPQVTRRRAPRTDPWAVEAQEWLDRLAPAHADNTPGTGGSRREG